MQKSKLWNWEPIKNWTSRLEILKNRNLYKENRDMTFSKGRQNLANAARTQVRNWQPLKVNNSETKLIVPRWGGEEFFYSLSHLSYSNSLH